MNEIMRRFVKGLIMERNSVVGSISMAVMLAGKHTQEEQTPVAYLYNGVRLPKLPEWDKTVYPYAYMVRYYQDETTRTVELWVSQSEMVYEFTFTASYWLKSPSVFFGYDIESDAWKVPIEHPDGTSFGLYDIIWANTDFYRTDGTIVIGASEPVPVYE